MAFILSCYYLDEPLGAEELAFVERTLLGPWARFKTGAEMLVQKRVPLVLPLPDLQDGGYSESREQRAQRIRPHLHHAGIRGDNGRQVVWVAPPNADWDAIFRFAIQTETGYAPFAVQRWSFDSSEPLRTALRVVDTQLLLQGL
ncbi:hypothetical protein [Noviherbaspirillum massiliense]|uniref:hypothetical protein n=1 Tax=Noviherbaspirillum massiliense TaxID=1465823 RepID=UPI0002DD04F4|nr:hypothetical protein [Noviherbaspirillum massiliense]